MLKKRIDRLLNEIGETAVYLTDSDDMYYYSGFAGEGGVVVSKDKRIVLTDGRYTEMAQKSCPGFEVLAINDMTLVLNSLKCPVVVQADSISYSMYLRLKEAGLELDPLKDVFDHLRSVKQEKEIECLKKAALIAEDVYKEVLKFLSVGKTEREIAAFIDYQIKLKGAGKNSFETICVSGKNTSLPHGVPTDKQLQNGEFITLDFGAKVDGYCSDMTRTVALGSVTDEMANVYDVVLKAQEKSQNAIKAGISCKEIDEIARDYIKENGYGEYFVHSLGHGVGLKIHEQPNLSPKSEKVLEVNNVVTVEPGIYIPDKFGVRIENTVIVTRTKAISLQKSSKELTIL